MWKSILNRKKQQVSLLLSLCSFVAVAAWNSLDLELFVSFDITLYYLINWPYSWFYYVFIVFP